MKNIKSLADINQLKGTNIPENVVAHIRRYFNWMMELFGNDYNPQEVGWIVLLEEGDPLEDVTFLEEDLGIRGGRTLLSICKEFVDFNAESNLFEVFALYNDEFGKVFIIPNEEWLGDELLHHLRTFKNDPGTSSNHEASILN